MEVNTVSFESAITSYLEKRAEGDELFAKSLKKPNKSIKECLNYIIQQVKASRKNGEMCVAVADMDVYNLAVHYYDEDDIKVDEPQTSVTVSAPTQAEPKPKKTRAKKVKAEVDANIPEPLEIPLF